MKGRIKTKFPKVEKSKEKESGGIVYVDHERQNVYLIGDVEGSMSVKGYVDMLAMMIRRLDIIDPFRVYRREWEETASR